MQNCTIPRSRFSSSCFTGAYSRRYCVVYRYAFNGKEKESEISAGDYDFGARIYDSRVARFLSMDKFTAKFAQLSPYGFAANTPIQALDFGGDSVWITTKHTQVQLSDGRTRIEITHTINVTVKILDLAGVTQSGGLGCSGPKPAIDQLANSVESRYNSISMGDGYETPTQSVSVKIDFNVDVVVVTSMDQVNKNDHLVVMVDEVYGSADKNLGGGGAGGLARLNGQIAYVESSYNWSWMVEAVIHELGHNMGLEHTKEEGNYMSYSESKNFFNIDQLKQVVHSGKNSELNKGENSTLSTSTTDNWFWHTSSNEEPYNLNTSVGEKIPLPIQNNQ